MTSLPHEHRPDVKPRLTPKRRRRVIENDEYAAFLARAIAAFGRRIAAGDIDALAAAAFLSARLDATLKTAITGLRARGYSWADIGLHLGITRQAAQQRWGEKPQPPAKPLQPDETPNAGHQQPCDCPWCGTD